MNSMPPNGAKKPALRCGSTKRKINNDQRTERGVTAAYRESGHSLSTDSGESSGHTSVCDDLDYQTSFENSKGNRYNGHQNSRDEIAEKLSKLKIDYEKNLKTDSGTVDDTMSGDDIKEHSIIAGNSPAHPIQHHSIQTFSDSRISIILAGRLDSRDNLFAHPAEYSLLNTALNESMETSSGNRSKNAELSRYVDSLDVQQEEVSSSCINERDSLEEGIFRADDDSGNQKAHEIFYENDENSDPNSADLGGKNQPRIIADHAVYPPISISRRLGGKSLVIADGEKSASSEHPAENSIHSDPTKNRFESLISDGERQVFKGVKTPNLKAIHFIENCHQSSPVVGVHADTFGSDFIADISELSSLGVRTLDQDKNAEPDLSREKILEIHSERFAKAPTEFTEKLLNLLEESILHNSKSETVNPDCSGISLRNITAEFRRMCEFYAKGIADESMPYEMKAGNVVSFNISNPSYLVGENTACQEAPVSPFQDFSKLGRGRKVYRKTPRRVLNANGNTQCRTPNCANVLHRGRNGNLYSPSYRTFGEELDTTTDFELWEKLCRETSPVKHPSKYPAPPSSNKSPGFMPLEDLIRKSDQQMASLEESFAVDSPNDRAEQRSLTTTPKDCQNHVDFMRQKFIENLSLSLGKVDSSETQRRQEIEQFLTTGLVEKRRKCFEEAMKVIEDKPGSADTKWQINSGGKSSDRGSEFVVENEPSREPDHKAVFFHTLSACADYIDHLRIAQYYKNPTHLERILECTEDSESLAERRNNSEPNEYVEAVILPVQNRANYRTERAEQSPKNANLVAQTSLYLHGTPGSSKEKSLSKSPRARSHLSPGRRRSSGSQSPSVLSNKIKSPVSPTRRKVIRAAKPASHACVPRTPSITPEIRASRNKQISSSGRSGVKSTPRLESNRKLKPAANSPGLVDVTNTKKRFGVPKLTITSASPLRDCQKKTGCSKVADENGDMGCQRKLHFSEEETPEQKQTKYFYTPGNTPSNGRVRQKKKYFETPKLPVHSPRPRLNFNTVQSPVGMYIRGTDPNLITNVKGKTNERMLTPRSKTPKSKSKVSSPILARSPCMSPKPTETAGLKFQLTPARRQKPEQDPDILNIALCESDPSSMIGSESTSHSPFPKIFYKPAQGVKMVEDNPPQRRCPKVLVRGAEEKMIYRHEGRLKSATKSKVPNFQADGSSKDSLSCDSGDISLLHQRPAVKSNYLFKK